MTQNPLLRLIGFVVCLFVVAAVVIFVTGSTSPSSSSPPPRLQLLSPALVGPLRSSASCDAQHTGCVGYVATLLNAIRAAQNEPKLRASWSLIRPTSQCRNARGHAQDMAISGSIWHQNADYPQDSFPNDICTGIWKAQNVGAATSTSATQGLRIITTAMMQEQHDPAYCALLEAEWQSNHACTILSTRYRYLGVGVVFTGATTWLVENFTDG